MKRRTFLKESLGTLGLSFANLERSTGALSGAPPERYPIRFVDVTSEAKIHFKHTNAASGQKYLMETMGPGCAFFDYDGDGYLDIYFVNGACLPGFQPDGELRNALYRNNHDGTFTDVTNEAGVKGHGYGMGVATGDYNNDGFQDLFVTNCGSSILYRNNGNGTFTDVTEAAGVNNKGWGTSAAFFDYDNNGVLDLFVGNYVEFSLERNIFCGPHPDLRAYCHPDQFQGAAPALYRNNGDGTFTEVSKLAGLADFKGKALGVVTADFNGDGYQDIYVANDSMANFLFINNRDGTFREIGELAGAAYDANGNARAGMGVWAADYDGDGRADILVTNLSFQGYTLYHNDSDGLFTDQSFPAGVGRPSLLFAGWGVGFFDYDNDGDEDILGVNGHVMDNIQHFSPTLNYLQPLLLLENREGRYVDVTRDRGESLNVCRPGRGAAFGDFDNDGDIDVLVANCNQAPTLLRNDGGNQNHWVKIQVVGRRSNRDGIGVKVKLAAGGRTQVKEIIGGGSYLSSHDRRLHFGIGTNERADRIEVYWPSGRRQVLNDVRANRILTIEEH